MKGVLLILNVKTIQMVYVMAVEFVTGIIFISNVIANDLNLKL